MEWKLEDLNGVEARQEIIGEEARGPHWSVSQRTSSEWKLEDLTGVEARQDLIGVEARGPHRS